ncbi:TPA: DUF2971 domain-containing protein [Enterobacter sichuanensis]|nr:DUF2971 domain-containing protein [Enterobacter sichuanensis]
MRSPHRMHERSTFYKYMSLNTGKIVLDSCSLRWSSPVRFNDPFDVPREVMPGIDEINIGKALARKLIAELINPREDIQNLNPRIRTMLEVYQKLFPFGIPPGLIEKFQEIVDDPPVGLGAPAAIQEMKDVWKGMLNDRRILCLSESPIITPMWNHYADEYKGIVIEFDCIDILDSAWLIAKPMKYTDEIPLTYTAEGMAELLFMPDNKSIEYINTEITFIKTEEWAYEKEWRISNYARPNTAGQYSDFKFHPFELKSVILGPLFDASEFDEVASLVKRYPRAQLFKSSFGGDRKISIEPIA